MRQEEMVEMADEEVSDILGRAKAAGTFIEWKGPAGMHPVRLEKLSTIEGSNYVTREPETRLVWEFVPIGYTGPGTLKLWSSFSTHEKSNFVALCRALEVPVPDANEDIRASAYVNRTCNALIEYQPSTKKPGTFFPRITRVFPATSGNGSAPERTVDSDVSF
jgi:hypothetical protein